MRYWLLTLLLLIALPASGQELPDVHLKVVGGLGQTIQFKNFEEPFWDKQLAERSHGHITAEVTPWDQFGIKGAELLQFTRLGAIMLSTVSLSQIASEDPEAAAVDRYLNDQVQLPTLTTLGPISAPTTTGTTGGGAAGAASP